MDAIEEGKDKVPDPAREHAPLIKFLWERGRTLTPRLKNKVMIYDCETRSLEVLSQKEVEKNSKEVAYKEIKLPRRTSEITIFVDPKTDSVTTTGQTPDGQSNILLAKLYLDRLGIWNQILRCLGHLSTLYVSNI